MRAGEIRMPNYKSVTDYQKAKQAEQRREAIAQQQSKVNELRQKHAQACQHGIFGRYRQELEEAEIELERLKNS
jgi:hypothetical protein